MSSAITNMGGRKGQLTAEESGGLIGALHNQERPLSLSPAELLERACSRWLLPLGENASNLLHIGEGDADSNSSYCAVLGNHMEEIVLHHEDTPSSSPTPTSCSTPHKIPAPCDLYCAALLHRDEGEGIMDQCLYLPGKREEVCGSSCNLQYQQELYQSLKRGHVFLDHRDMRELSATMVPGPARAPKLGLNVTEVGTVATETRRAPSCRVKATARRKNLLPLEDCSRTCCKVSVTAPANAEAVQHAVKRLRRTLVGTCYTSDNRALTVRDIRMIAGRHHGGAAHRYLVLAAFRRALDILVVGVVGHSFFRWKNLTISERKDEMRRALEVVRRYLLKRLKKWRVEALQPVAQVLHTSRSDTAPLSTDDQRAAVKLEQHNHSGKKMLHDCHERVQHVAACKIKQTYMLYRERTRIAHQGNLHAKRGSSAICIQRYQRGYFARSRVRALRKVRTISKLGAQRIKDSLNLRYSFLRHGAASCIQAWWRAHMLLRSLKLVVLRASVTYATRIQNVVRAHLANRKRLARLKQHHAAVVIQRTWRTQREMQKRWYAHNKRVIVARLVASGGAEKSKRGRVKSHIFDAYRIRNNRPKKQSPSGQREVSAVVMQQLYRGWIARRLAHRLQTEKIAGAAMVQESMRACAAKTIQRFWRKRARYRWVRASLIQKVWRSLLIRRARKVERAVCDVQRVVRGWLGRLRLARVTQSLDNLRLSTFTIQRAAHGWIARRRHKITQQNLVWQTEEKAAASATINLLHRRAYLTLLPKEVLRMVPPTGLDQTEFARLLRNAGVIRRGLEQANLDLIFSSLCQRKLGVHRIGPDQFMEGLEEISAALFPTANHYDGFPTFRARASRFLALTEGCLLNASWATQHREHASQTSANYVDNNARVIQRVMCAWRRRSDSRRLLLDLRAKRAHQVRTDAAIAIQCHQRQMLGRLLCARMAQIVLDKFLDPGTQRLYWFNPRTGRTTWEKPKVLAWLDCPRITTLPDRTTELLIKCSQCTERDVDCWCAECSDSFCRSCFTKVHARGKQRRQHESHPVYRCSYCHYQHASRMVRSGIRALYMCDVCFENEWAHTPKQRRKVERLSIGCAECDGAFTVRWFCHDCREMFCTQCFPKIHSHGSKRDHGPERLPYVTRDMDFRSHR